jgi:hypothetical protein
MAHQVLAAWYPCHQRPANVVRACASFRAAYPDAPLTLCCDGGADFAPLAAKLGAAYAWYPPLNDAGRPLLYADAERAVEWLARLWAALAAWPRAVTHFLMLEDDVRVLRRHTRRFAHTISGYSVLAWMPRPWVDDVAAARPRYAGVSLNYGGCGGAVFDAAFFRALPFAEVADGVRGLAARGIAAFPTDLLLSWVAYRWGGSVGGHPEFGQLNMAGIARQLAGGDIAFLHQFKAEYGDEPTADERALLER